MADKLMRSLNFEGEDIYYPAPGVMMAYPATSTDGITYNVTIPGITEITAGMTIMVIPNMKPTTISFKLNVNGLVSASIRRKLTSGQAGVSGIKQLENFSPNVPVLLSAITSSNWIILDGVKPYWADIGNNPIPTVTTEDAGKVLMVGDDGAWAATAIANAEDGAY